MWIFDSCYRGSVDLWTIEGESVRRTRVACPPSFYLHLPDPTLHWEMIEALESLYKVEECSFRTIYGDLDGYRICADRGVAEKIEKQTKYAAELYNVDVRMDQRYLAERGIFPCGCPGEERFNPDFEHPLGIMELEVYGNPGFDKEISRLEISGCVHERLGGSEKKVLSDLFDIVKAADPDVLLFPYADTWTLLMERKAREYGVEDTISRSGLYRKLDSRSYWSYGRACHRENALIPDGRILIDTKKSFTYREGGLPGVLLASRLSGLSPNLVSRFSPGTLISAYEIYWAINKGIAVPFRKRNPERMRSFSELRASDKGGMIFQPEPGVYERVHQLDFTSMYPSIIVKNNLSPETVGPGARKMEGVFKGVGCAAGKDVGSVVGNAIGNAAGILDGDGFLKSAIAPLLDLRIKTKQLKKLDQKYSGMDSVLKWMLVTCFGYTGYKNAKFGQIEVHEQICAISREHLMRTKEIAEEMDLKVLHGIVDCLWVSGGSISPFKEKVEREIGIPAEVESYDWIAFLPMADGTGAYNRYFGRLSSGKMKIRGVLARRGDTPEYVRRMQMEMLSAMAAARRADELLELEDLVGEIGKRYIDGLPNADIRELVIQRRVGRLNGSRRSAEASAVDAYRRPGISVAPGMVLGYVVKDSRRWIVDSIWDLSEFDRRYYERLLEKAQSEVAFVFVDLRKLRA